MKAIFIFIGSLMAVSIAAQSPEPAPPQVGSLLILGGTAHIGTGAVIENSYLVLENGRIAAIGDAATLRLNRSAYGRIVEARGKHIYPGFIACNSTVGLVEIEAVRPTQDNTEVGSYNPNVRAIVAYNADSEVPPTLRTNGVLIAQSCPSGGTLAGISAVVQLDAWNWEDALVREDGIHLNWPAQRRQEGWGSQESKANEGYEKEVMALYQFFDEARAYIAKAAPVVRNQKFEALRPLFAGSMALYLHVGGARLIQEAVLFAERYGVKPVLSASPDAWKQAAFLKEHGVPVILSETQRLPATEDEAIDQPERGAVVLHAAGVPFAFSGTGFWRQRNLPFHAGQSVGVGLPYEAAIRALTLDAAKILGVGDRLGSLEVGKEATLFISSGDALDMRSCLVSDIFIAGRAVSTDNRHKRLARKYSKGS